MVIKKYILCWLFPWPSVDCQIAVLRNSWILGGDRSKLEDELYYLSEAVKDQRSRWEGAASKTKADLPGHIVKTAIPRNGYSRAASL